MNRALPAIPAEASGFGTSKVITAGAAMLGKTFGTVTLGKSIFSFVHFL
jgi:hypothetical protein